MAGKGIQIQSFKGSNDGVEDPKEYIENVEDDVEDCMGKIQLRRHNELRKQTKGLMVPIQMIKNMLMGQLFMKGDKVENSD
ncbi:hypothetical protein FQN51_001249 [Onygenales sp. PD_10]|nr:hypothetical protein FQN51_001249 [Onygenales sp. PD_10]